MALPDYEDALAVIAKEMIDNNLAPIRIIMDVARRIDELYGPLFEPPYAEPVIGTVGSLMVAAASIGVVIEG